MSNNTEYSLRQHTDHVTVTKWEDETPTQVYTVKGKFDCDCPGAVHHKTECRHIRLAAAWRRLDRPEGMRFRVSNRTGTIIPLATRVAEDQQL